MMNEIPSDNRCFAPAQTSKALSSAKMKEPTDYPSFATERNALSASLVSQFESAFFVQT